MEITTDVPEWMAHDWEAKTGEKLGVAFVERAVRVYWGRLYDPLYNPNLSEQTLIAIYGDSE